MSDLLSTLDSLVENPIDPSTLVAEPSAKKLTYEDFPFDRLNVYAGLDCIGTSELLGRLMPALTQVEFPKVGKTTQRAPAILESFHSIEIPSQEFIIDLEINGMGYSVERNRLINTWMDSRVAELDEQIYSLLGEKVDMNSGPVMAEFLYGKKGFTPPYTTKGGEPATDGAALMLLAGLDPTVPFYQTPDPSLQYLAYMAQRKDIFSTCNTFVRTYVRDFVKRDGRIHPSYNQFGTSSFRITGSDPNLTQLPRPKHGFNVRTCYTVRNGYVFISFDFSSAEVKILANICKDPGMLKAIADGLDFHTFSAAQLRGISYEEIAAVLADKRHRLFKEYKGLRQLSKILTFSILYGSSIAGIAKQLNMEASKAQDIVDLYFRIFPGIRKYVEDTHAFARDNQYVITPLGQRKREYGTYPCFRNSAAFNASLRNAQNVIIQSATSSVGLATFAEVNRRIKPFGAISTCTVYDSIEIECPIENAAAVINLCYQTLDTYPQEAFPFIELPIGCEGDVGISWGETEVVHPGVTQEEVLALIIKLREDSRLVFAGA